MLLNRLELIKQHFSYLFDRYGFHVDRERYTPDVMGNAFVVFKSALTGISVVIDRNQVLINIGDLSTSQTEWFEFSDAVKFFEPSIKDVYIFSQTIEEQIIRLATILLRCEPLLKGEFWMKDEIKKIEEKRVAEMLENFKKGSTG